jgi:hypothetical protein
MTNLAQDNYDTCVQTDLLLDDLCALKWNLKDLEDIIQRISVPTYIWSNIDTGLLSCLKAVAKECLVEMETHNWPWGIATGETKE